MQELLRVADTSPPPLVLSEFPRFQEICFPHVAAPGFQITPVSFWVALQLCSSQGVKCLQQRWIQFQRCKQHFAPSIGISHGCQKQHRSGLSSVFHEMICKRPKGKKYGGVQLIEISSSMKCRGKSPVGLVTNDRFHPSQYCQTVTIYHRIQTCISGTFLMEMRNEISFTNWFTSRLNH